MRSSEERTSEDSSIKGGMAAASSDVRGGGREVKESGESMAPSRTVSSSRPSEDYGVDCPGCRERIAGATEAETSERLRTHMEAEHKNESYMTRLKERLTGRR